MNILHCAFDVASAVETFMGKAQSYFYSVVLLAYRCPCCNGRLRMLAEGRCMCVRCSNEIDPTVVFQRCPACGGTPALSVRRYQCQNCGNDIPSRFLFDGMVFNADYFRQKMYESRQRKKQQKERIRKMLQECRSTDMPLPYADLATVPDLVEALNALTSNIGKHVSRELHNSFDLNLYQRHIQAHIQDFPIDLHDIPSLGENARKDLIWRFIAVVFLWHMGVIDIEQEQERIMVIRHEIDH